MYKILKLILFAFFIFGCNSQPKNKIVTIKKFTKIYFDSLTIRFRGINISIIDDSTIQCIFKGLKTRDCVYNAYKEYLFKPDSVKKILSRFILVTSELFNERGKINIYRIVPIIKPADYLIDIKNSANEMGATKDVEGVYEKYNDQLIIVYAEDRENSIRYLTHDDLKLLSIKAGILKIKKAAKKSFATGSYQVSDYLYKWNGNRFEKYDKIS